MRQKWNLRVEPAGLADCHVYNVPSSAPAPVWACGSILPQLLFVWRNGWYNWTVRAFPDSTRSRAPHCLSPAQPHFREQFEISHPTPRYSGLLALLPSVLVASAEQITALVQLLCAEMSLAFEHHGLSLPPWRQSKSLLSK